MAEGLSGLSQAVRRRLAFWGPLLAKFFWLQAIAQLLAIASGLLIVRWLAVEAFAVYTVAIAVQTTAAILADSGITQSLLARGGSAAGDRRRFTEVINTALALRRRLEAATLCIAVPLLFYLLHANRVSWVAAVPAAGAVVLAVHASVDQTVFSTVLMLQLRPIEAQRGALVSGVLRLLLLLGLLLAGAQWVLVLWIGAIALAVQGSLVKRSAVQELVDHRDISVEDRQAMLVAFRNQFLNGVYFALQPQVTVWVMTVFGTVQKIAEVGALGRLAIAFSLVSATFSSIALPRFARISDPAMVRRYYAALIAAVIAIGAVAVAIAAAAPRLILAILGSGYMHLQSELVWMTAASAVTLLASAVYLLNTARGWVRGIWLGVPATIVTQLAVAMFVDLSTVKGAILLQASAFAAPFLINVAIGWRGMRGLNAQPAAIQDPRVPNTIGR
jgi:hypothetical protein